MIAAIIDTVTILLLIGSITYGYLVSRKVRRLMQSLHELEPLVSAFSLAVDKSEYSVVKMRESIQEAQRQPQPEPAPETRHEEATFSSRREAPAAGSEVAGMRVMRDKKEMVRAFFESSSAAKV
jgi:hypothetical protein